MGSYDALLIVIALNLSDTRRALLLDRVEDVRHCCEGKWNDPLMLSPWQLLYWVDWSGIAVHWQIAAQTVTTKFC